MKKLILIFTVLTLLLSFCGCLKPGTKTNKDEKITVTETPKDKESCEKANGIWGRIGLGPVDQCNLKTTDGGKECKDSDECDGTCIGELDSLRDAEKIIGTEAKGTCSYVMTIVGCHAFVEDGKVDQVLCID